MDPKRFLAFLFLSAAVGGFLAADDKIPLNIMTYGDNSSPEGTVIKELVTGFEAANPGVVVTYETLFNDAFHDKAKARIAGKTAPDVIYLWPGSKSGYVYNAGLGVDFRPYIKDKSIYAPGALAPQGPNGEVWELPMALTVSSVLYENIDLAKKLNVGPITSYNDLVKLVAPFKKQGLTVISFAGGEDWVYNSCLVSTLVGRFTGEPNFVKNVVEGKKGYSFNDKRFVKALAFMQKMFKDGVISVDSISNDYGASLATFLREKSLFTLDGDWRSDSMGGEDNPGFEKSVVMGILPPLPGEVLHNSTSVVAGTGYGLTKNALRDPKIRDAAVKFVNYFQSMEWATKRLTHGVSATILVALAKNPPAETPYLMKQRLSLANSVVSTDVMDNFIPDQAMAPFAANIVKLLTQKDRMTPEMVCAQLDKDTRYAIAHPSNDDDN